MMVEMIIKSCTWEKNPWKGGGLLPWVLVFTPTANAWLNPMMDDNSDQDSDKLDDDVHVPMTTATNNSYNDALIRVTRRVCNNQTENKK